MEFDPTTSIPVKERPDGLLEEDTFDPITANPVTETFIGEYRGPIKFTPPLTDEDRARATVELMYKEQGKDVPLGIKMDWALTSQPARAATKMAVWTTLTSGLYPVVAGLTGALESGTGLSLMDRVTKGVMYPEHTKEIYEKIPGSETWPLWGKLLAGVTETIAKYGAFGYAKSILKGRLFARKIVRDIDKAADKGAEELIKSKGVAYPKPQPKTGEGIVKQEPAYKRAMEGYTETKRQIKEKIINEYYSKLSAIDVQTLKTGLQETAKKTSMISMVGSELEASGVSLGMSIKPVVGQQVSFTEGGKNLVGKIVEVMGGRVKIDMGGKMVVATIEQLTSEFTKKVGEQVDPEYGLGWEDDISNIISPESIKPVNGISKLDEKIAKLKDQEKSLAVSRESVEALKEMQKDMKGRIRPYKKGAGDLLEEYQEIPAKYRSKDVKFGIVMDEAASELSLMGVNVTEATLSDYLKNLDSQVERLKSQIELEKTPYVRMKEMTNLKQRVRDIVRGQREGKVLAKKEVEESQKQIIKLLASSELDSDDKGVFMSSMKNIKTQEQLEKAMPAISERIAKIEELKRKRKVIDKFKKLSGKNALKDLRPEYKTQVQGIVDQFDMAKISEAKAKDLNKLADYLVSDPDNAVPQERLDELKRLEKKPLRDMTSEEIENIVSAIQHLVKLNQLKNKLIVKGKLVEHQKVVDEAVLNVNKKFDHLPGSVSGLDSLTKIKEDNNFTKIVDGYHSNTELKSEILDGEDGGIIQQVMYGGIDKGTDNQIVVVHTAENFFKEKLSGINMDKWSAAFQVKNKDVIQYTHKIKGYDEPIKITPGEKIAFYLHTLNDKNLKHLQEGGFSFPNTLTKIIKFKDPSDIFDISGSLTEEEMIVATAINEYLNTIGKDAINEVSVRLNGIEIALEPNYWMIRTNFLDRFQDQLLKGEMGMSAKATLEGMGIFKQRQSTSNAIILEDAFSAFAKHIKKVSAYVGFAEPLRSAKAIVNDNDFQKAVINAGKSYYLSQMKDYLAKVEGEYLRTDGLDVLIQERINILDLSILGGNPFIVAYQPVSYMLASTELSGDYLGTSYKLSPSEEETAEIMKYAPQLADRLAGNISREIGEVMNIGFAKKFFTGKGSEGQWLMSGIRASDTSAITSIWRAVKKEVSAQHPKLTGDKYFEKVYERAWLVIRRTQPTFHVKDRSPMGAKRDTFWRLATKYTSQRNKNIMIQRRAYENYNRSHKTPEDKASLAKKMILVNIVTSGMIAAVRMIRSRIMDKDPKRSIVNKKEDANIFEEFVTEVIKTSIGNVYVLGSAFDTLISKLQKSIFGGYDISDPVTSTVNEIVDVTTNFLNTISYAISGERYKPESGRLIGEKKWKKSMENFLSESVDLSGKLYFGLPLELWRKFIVAQHKRFSK